MAVLLIPAAKNTSAALREPCVPGLTWLSPREPTQGTAMGEPGEEHGKGEDAAPTGTPQPGRGWGSPRVAPAAAGIVQVPQVGCNGVK